MDPTKEFDEIDAKRIAAFINHRQEENLQLEFKTVRSADLNDRNDRRNLAKTISAFANSAGGVIVWGVEARPNEERMDCASREAPIDPVQRLLAALNENSPQAVHPVVDGVRHRAIPTDGTRGFVVTLVPESQRTPHMAKLGEDRYYKRNGGSSLKMEHFDLEDMFGRRQTPQLRPKIDVAPVAPSEAPSGQRLFFALRNFGRAVARYAGCTVSLPIGTRLIRAQGGLRDISNLNQGRAVAEYSDNVGVIHPNGYWTHIGELTVERPDPTQSLLITIRVYCDGMAWKEFPIELAPVPAH